MKVLAIRRELAPERKLVVSKNVGGAEKKMNEQEAYNSHDLKLGLTIESSRQSISGDGAEPPLVSSEFLFFLRFRNGGE